MTSGALIICVVCQFCLVGGNLLLKQSMSATHVIPIPWIRVATCLSAGIALLTLWFFLWLGLLSSWDLTQVFPFEGLSPPLILLGAWLFLGERISIRGWVGIAMIGAGIVVLAAS